jgi:hypothetical protein
VFPFLEEEFGTLTEYHRNVAATLAIVRVEECIKDEYWFGRPASSRKVLGRAFVAKAVSNAPTTSDFRNRILADSVLRRICGWEERGQVPSVSTFSRVFREFAESKLAGHVHKTLIDRTFSDQGYRESWNGFKLHIDSGDGQIPISCLLTSASVHDSQVSIPLTTLTCQRVKSLYELKDSAYDCQHIAAYSRRMGHVPIIDPNPRNGEGRELTPAEKIRYRERTTAERVNARLKDEFGGRMIRVRGAAKVMAHLMFGILALTADQLMRMVQ